MPYTINAEQMERIWEMPRLSHYPDRTKKFSFDNSHVIAFLSKTLDVNLVDATRAFEKVRRAKDIVYDPVDKVWMGRRLMEPNPQPASQ